MLCGVSGGGPGHAHNASPITAAAGFNKRRHPPAPNIDSRFPPPHTLRLLRSIRAGVELIDDARRSPARPAEEGVAGGTPRATTIGLSVSPVTCPLTLSREERFRDTSRFADLCSERTDVRAGRGRLSLSPPTDGNISTSPAASRSPRSATPSPSREGAHRAGAEALALLEPVPDPGPAAPGRAPDRPYLRRDGVLLQFGRRGGGMRHQGRAQVPCRDRSSRALSASSAAPARSTAARWRRSPPPETRNTCTGFGPPAPGFDHVAFGNLNEMRQRSAARDRGASWSSRCRAKAASRGARATISRACAPSATSSACFWSRRGAMRHGPHRASSSPMNGRASRPTCMAAAKALGGGFPVGACLATERAAVGMTAGTHGSTFGGNPLAMAVGQRRARRDARAGLLRAGRRASAACLRRRLEALVDGLSQGLRRGARQGPARGLANASCPTPRWSSKLRARRPADRRRPARMWCGCCRRSSSRSGHVDEAIGIIEGVARQWAA